MLKHWYVGGILLVVKVMASAEPFEAQLFSVAGEKEKVRFVLLVVSINVPMV